MSTTTTDRTVATGRTPEGHRILEEQWEDGTFTYWNCYAGRRATDAEVIAVGTNWKWNTSHLFR